MGRKTSPYLSYSESAPCTKSLHPSEQHSWDNGTGKHSPLDPSVSTAPPTAALRNYTVHPTYLMLINHVSKVTYSSSSTGEGPTLRGQTPCADSQLRLLKFKGFPASPFLPPQTVAGNECSHCDQTESKPWFDHLVTGSKANCLHLYVLAYSSYTWNKIIPFIED